MQHTIYITKDICDEILEEDIDAGEAILNEVLRSRIAFPKDVALAISEAIHTPGLCAPDEERTKRSAFPVIWNKVTYQLEPRDTEEMIEEVLLNLDTVIQALPKLTHFLQGQVIDLTRALQLLALEKGEEEE